MHFVFRLGSHVHKLSTSGSEDLRKGVANLL